ncbi:porin family protein [Lentimicrobium sp. S6]|uniref:porin family protein n=1 Tax=Lentimicrobium sp. S6 TaxID=2735872 RepID=UPI0015560A2E|nr:porin family protein [Lentimicrobium sp. S6]NPD44565.1 PorT family protein [Lentimicrobium sp. S6]
MKKIFITLLVLFSISSFAQNHFIGAQFGLGSSDSFGTEWVKNDKSLNSFSTGLTYDFKLKNNILLGSGLIYERRGSEENRASLWNPSDSKMRFDYLMIPVKAGYQIGNKWSGYAYLGLVPAYLLKADKKSPERTYPHGSDDPIISNVTESMNRFNLSVMFELGCNYQLNNKLSLFVSGSYLREITEVYKDLDSYSFRYHRLNISLGVKYALKSE